MSIIWFRKHSIQSIYIPTSDTRSKCGIVFILIGSKKSSSSKPKSGCTIPRTHPITSATSSSQITWWSSNSHNFVMNCGRLSRALPIWLYKSLRTSPVNSRNNRVVPFRLKLSTKSMYCCLRLSQGDVWNLSQCFFNSGSKKWVSINWRYSFIW